MLALTYDERMPRFIVVIALGSALAQTVPGVTALRTAPVEKFTVNGGFRDWAPTVLVGTTIMGGNSSNRGGLFAVDTVSGKLKWTFRPAGTASGNPFVATAPAVSGGVAIAPMGNTLVAVTIATGREAWRGPATAQSAAVAADGGATLFPARTRTSTRSMPRPDARNGRCRFHPGDRVS